MVRATPIRRALAAPAVAMALLAFSGCGPSGGPPPHPAATVTAMHPVQKQVTDWEDFPGRLQSPQITSIQARVSGLITQTPFKEGALAHEGDILFVIDDRPFQADLDNKKANVAKDAAQVDLTNAQLARSKRLLETHVVDQQDFDIAEANFRQAQAQLQADEAAVETSELNFEWTRVRAPITGLVGKIDVTIGNLITGGVGNGTALTTLVSVDPLYCYAAVPERIFLKYQAYARKTGVGVRKAKIDCSVQLEDETGFLHRGVIDFIDNSVDPNTGTIQMRGVFQNPDAFLTPGLFARMRIEGGGAESALLVPDEAVGTEQNEHYLLVLDANDTVQQRRVELGWLVGEQRVIEEGVSTGDRVIVDGLQMAIPGTKVNVEMAPAGTASPAPGATGATGTGS